MLSFATLCGTSFCRECCSMSRASQLGPHKVPYVAPANSKEHEVQVTALRRGGRVGRACGTAGPGTSPFDARENFPSEQPNEHDSQVTVQGRRPARGERLRFLEPDRRRTGPTGAGREMGAGEKRPSTTAISSTLIAIGCLFMLREDSAVTTPESQIDLCAGTSVSRLASRRAKQHCTRPHRIAHSSF